MLDLFHLPPSSKADVKVYKDPSAGTDYHTWIKPRGISMVTFYAFGGGGGGGSGFTAASGNQRGGGGGGGPGAVSIITVPAMVIPDRVYISVGAGGDTFTAGNASWVRLFSPTTSGSVLLNAPGGSRGNNGTGAAGGTAGGSTAATLGVMHFGTLGNWRSIAGQSGTAGSASASATARTILNTSMLSPGTGGGGVTNLDVAGTGGDLTGSGPVPTSPGGTTGGGAGTNGYIYSQNPLISIGGTGGGGHGTGTGGKGGDGGMGSGGGGGGGGVTGGAGGRGGDGMVIVIAW